MRRHFHCYYGGGYGAGDSFGGGSYGGGGYGRGSYGAGGYRDTTSADTSAADTGTTDTSSADTGTVAPTDTASAGSMLDAGNQAAADASAAAAAAGGTDTGGAGAVAGADTGGGGAGGGSVDAGAGGGTDTGTTDTGAVADQAGALAQDLAAQGGTLQAGQSLTGDPRGLPGAVQDATGAVSQIGPSGRPDPGSALGSFGSRGTFATAGGGGAGAVAPASSADALALSAGDILAQPSDPFSVGQAQSGQPGFLGSTKATAAEQKAADAAAGRVPPSDLATSRSMLSPENQAAAAASANDQLAGTQYAELGASDVPAYQAAASQNTLTPSDIAANPAYMPSPGYSGLPTGGIPPSPWLGNQMLNPSNAAAAQASAELAAQAPQTTADIPQAGAPSPTDIVPQTTSPTGFPIAGTAPANPQILGGALQPPAAGAQGPFYTFGGNLPQDLSLNATVGNQANLEAATQQRANELLGGAQSQTNVASGVGALQDAFRYAAGGQLTSEMADTSAMPPGPADLTGSPYDVGGGQFSFNPITGPTAAEQVASRFPQSPADVASQYGVSDLGYLQQGAGSTSPAPDTFAGQFGPAEAGLLASQQTLGPVRDTFAGQFGPAEAGLLANPAPAGAPAVGLPGFAQSVPGGVPQGFDVVPPIQATPLEPGATRPSDVVRPSPSFDFGPVASTEPNFFAGGTPVQTVSPTTASTTAPTAPATPGTPGTQGPTTPGLSGGDTTPSRQAGAAATGGAAPLAGVTADIAPRGGFERGQPPFNQQGLPPAPQVVNAMVANASPAVQQAAASLSTAQQTQVSQYAFGLINQWRQYLLGQGFTQPEQSPQWQQTILPNIQQQTQQYVVQVTGRSNPAAANQIVSQAA